VCLVLLLATTTITGHEAVFAGAASSQGRILEVSVDSGRLTLRAQEAPLAEVLKAVGRQAGVTIALRGNLDALVTETLVDVPVDEGIRRLTRRQSVVLVYDDQTDGRDSVELTEVVAIAASAPENETRASDVRSNPRRGNTSFLSEDRIGVREQGSNAVSVLRQIAATDPSPNMRQTALQKLARQLGVDAIKELREAALRDPEPVVRQAAIRALAHIRTAEAGDALRLMLNDSDSQLRELASHVLARWRERIR
jgi:HEAT repeats